ncbi:MAG TPA: SMC family ATPase, partial [Dehalococcoidia bacterium]|nr:SMC family ATPase [Dehalococcoidia bacterium]
MIPLSVRMTGWMRYRDEQVADFRGGSLIAICGENGAGKSSIFDAITFALYGQHRLGKQQATQLISQDMDRLSVEFEFEVDGQRYLVRRSRGQKQGERDQSLWVWDDGASEWAAVPGTEKEDGLDRAIANIVRLSYEAFTSSFLLQQNAATEFLDADPKHRFTILSSLIGLREYEAIERAALAGARDATKYLERVKQDLDGTEDFDE